MASTPFEADLDKLLAPISAEAPAGTSLRYEGTYAKIQEARREDDPTLPQGVWEKKLKARDDRLVISLATEGNDDLVVAKRLVEHVGHVDRVVPMVPLGFDARIVAEDPGEDVAVQVGAGEGLVRVAAVGAEDVLGDQAMVAVDTAGVAERVFDGVQA